MIDTVLAATPGHLPRPGPGTPRTALEPEHGDDIAE